MATGVVKLNPHNPAGEGLEPWEEIPPSDLISGTPKQRGLLVHEDKAQGLSVGVWDCTAMTAKLEPYSVHEFMYLLDGDVTMVDAKGHEETIAAGQAFVLPKGFTCQWRQEGYLRKFFVILEDSSDAPPSVDAVVRPQPYGPAEGLTEMELDAADFITAKPVQRQHIDYADPSGRFLAGTWDATPYERPVTPSKRNELMHILEGSVTMTSDSGPDLTFHAGDTFFVPQGAPCGWRSEVYVRKFFCIFQST
ncbi:MAG: cupin domain-containing protein [Rhodospirillales bacterium]